VFHRWSATRRFASMEQAPDWHLLDDAHRIERTFRFPNFAEALAFVQRAFFPTRLGIRQRGPRVTSPSFRSNEACDCAFGSSRL
jgi:Pterin 4 alpha carbinolamine dehydratase